MTNVSNPKKEKEQDFLLSFLLKKHLAESTSIKTDELQAHLVEYQELRSELLYYLKQEQQILLIVFGSASIAIPLLVGQNLNIAAEIIGFILFSLSIAYSVSTMLYATSFHMIGRITRYINIHMDPRVNSILGLKEHEILHWENFSRTERSRVTSAFLEAVGPTASVFALILPNALTIFAGRYILSLGNAQSNLSVYIQVLNTILPIIQLVAWFALFVAIISLIIGVVNVFTHDNWVKKVSKP